MELASRVGRFRVHGHSFHRLAPDEGINLFNRMVVLDVRRLWSTDEAEYLAIHPDFRPRVEGEIIPEYQAVFNAGSAFPQWVEIKDGAQWTR